jgi:SAM-dependent methyltransferase
MLATHRVRGYPADRSEERLRAHWAVERELADRLRNASRAERTTLYGTVYDELFRRVPDHPQHLWQADPVQRKTSAAVQAALVRRFLPERGIFLEIGAGDCALSLAVAPDAERVYAIEVSREIAYGGDTPPNFELLITDGREIPVESGTVDLAYSNQLMEHLHPEDAAEQVGHIFSCLRSGGRYLCFTPSRLLGPGDISKYFEDEIALGFHLHEYDNRELRELFTKAGFGSVHVVARLKGRMTTLPLAPFAAAEMMFEALPLAMRTRLKHRWLIRRLLSPGGGVIATKP